MHATTTVAIYQSVTYVSTFKNVSTCKWSSTCQHFSTKLPAVLIRQFCIAKVSYHNVYILYKHRKFSVIWKLLQWFNATAHISPLMAALNETFNFKNTVQLKPVLLTLKLYEKYSAWWWLKTNTSLIFSWCCTCWDMPLILYFSYSNHVVP